MGNNIGQTVGFINSETAFDKQCYSIDGSYTNGDGSFGSISYSSGWSNTPDLQFTTYWNTDPNSDFVATNSASSGSAINMIGSVNLYNGNSGDVRMYDDVSAYCKPY